MTLSKKNGGRHIRMRTKREIMEDFKHLGFTVEENKEQLTFYGFLEYITFFKKEKLVNTSDYYHINMKVLKLIYELCKFWGWLHE